MADLYQPITSPASGNGSAYVGNTVRASWGELVRQAVSVLARMKTLDLGGSETQGVTSGSPTWTPVPQRREHELTADDFNGLTVEAIIWTWTQNAATTVNWRLYDVDAATALVTGTAHASTTPTRQTAATVTLPATKHWVRLEVQGSNATWTIGAWGYLRVKT